MSILNTQQPQQRLLKTTIDGSTEMCELQTEYTASRLPAANPLTSG
jgi:hypothetical protein